jgi:hypothetical protein
MTSLVVWSGVDTHGPASVYIASDSRISWEVDSAWNYGRKLFASIKYPEVLGYYGDVLFPSQVLSRVVDLIDRDILFSDAMAPSEKSERVAEIIRKSLDDYPPRQLASQSFAVVYATRESEGTTSRFHVFLMGWSGSSGWLKEALTVPNESTVIRAFGSGARNIAKWHERWSRAQKARTSRGVFSALCDSIYSNEDRLSGGAPQLVGIYRKWPAKLFGIVYQHERFIGGLPVECSSHLSKIDWRNSLFERCDWQTMEPMRGAQPHNRPRGLGMSSNDQT